MKLKKLFAVLLSFVLILSNTIVVYAASGPHKKLGYLLIYNDKQSVYLYNNFSADPVGQISGATYDKNTNKLTLTKFNQPTMRVTTNAMGDNFRIKLIGNSHVQEISLWGEGHGGSCEFTGSGNLFVNENKLMDTAIYLAPEDSDSHLKASEGATITAYSGANGYSLFVDGTEDPYTVIGNSSVTHKVENRYVSKGVPVIKTIGTTLHTYDVYTKKDSDSVYTVDFDVYPNITYYSIYEIVKNPVDGSDILCICVRDSGEFEPSHYNLTKTDYTVDAYTTSYDLFASEWRDNDGNEFVFMPTTDKETGKNYYKKYAVAPFVISEDTHGGSVDWHRIYPTDDTTKYADDITAPAKAGYIDEKEAVQGLYNITVSASPYILNAADHIHSYKNVVIKASTTKNGKIVPTCSCGATKAATTIYYPKTVTLSTTSYVYDGKVKKPAVKVVGSNGKTISASNYTAAYISGYKIGKYGVKITFKGNYSGTSTLYYYIVPKGTTISSVTAASKAFTVKWKKQSYQTNGYEIQCATDSAFTKNKKTITVAKPSATSYKMTKLSAKKKYFVRVRTYRKAGNTRIYSSWSPTKTVTTKK